ncbi:MAG: DUF881 domain-containing protein [Mycobacteriaceae bacterium]|nr:DUF881 domain-containing protein [Mycobacteriaceae bacterium]MBV9639941.1 DUF881 domain-containing protein [Mycobacteriaceae bacterium]
MNEHFTEHGRHEFPPDAPARRRVGVFGVLGVLLCVLLGAAIVTQARRTQSGDALESARPADLVVLLDSLQQREASLNKEVGDLQRTLAALRASGSDDKAAVADAQARLSALSILIGTAAATGPGVTLTIDDTANGVAAETMIDVINELRAAGAEAMEIRGGPPTQPTAVRVGVDTWVMGNPGALSVDGQTLSPPYTVVAIGDPPTLAAAMNIPGGAVDSVERVGATMSVAQSDHVDVTALRQPKPRQYAQPVK